MRQRKTFFPATVSVGRTLITAGPVVVPADFIGLQANRWPIGTPVSPPPSHLRYGCYRSHDGGTFWANINTAPGVYDWSVLDTQVRAHRSAGATYMYTVKQTPTWAATPEGNTKPDPYGYLGGSDKPANLSNLSTFITALVTRYNSPGGAWRLANPTLGPGIKYLESWNEPRFFASGAETWNPVLFFWRSAGDMVDMVETVRAAAKAADPTITVLSPGWDNFHLATTAAIWPTTTGPITSKTGIQTIDGWATHAYRAEPYGVMGIDTNAQWGMAYCRSILAAAGAPTMPIYQTEWGVDGFVGSKVLERFFAGNAAQRRAWVSRTPIMAALVGVKMFVMYAYDNRIQTWGDSLNDTEGSIAGHNLAAEIAGKTLTDAYLLTDGRISVKVNGVDRVF